MVAKEDSLNSAHPGDLAEQTPLQGSTANPDYPLVTLVIPAHNEAGILEENLAKILAYLETLEDQYLWEILLVNDGSSDDTGHRAEVIAAAHSNMRVLHHRRNFGLGQALQYAFNQAQGDYIVTLDLDLSYAPEHIGRLLETAEATGAKVVAASPYMKGGRLSDVPWLRRTLSVWANRFLSVAARGNLSTLTGMVRVYDGRFIRSLNVRSTGPEVNAELIHKTMLLNGRIEEIPAHLDWGQQSPERQSRGSNLRILRQTMSVLLSGFLFRPVAFFILPGLLILILGIYSSVWALIHFGRQFSRLDQYTWIMDRASFATAAAFEEFPHTFIVAGLSMMLAIQLIGLGILALQSKSYFEEIYHLGITNYRSARSGSLQSTLESSDADSGSGDPRKS